MHHFEVFKFIHLKALDHSTPLVSIKKKKQLANITGERNSILCWDTVNTEYKKIYTR